MRRKDDAWALTSFTASPGTAVPHERRTLCLVRPQRRPHRAELRGWPAGSLGTSCSARPCARSARLASPGGRRPSVDSHEPARIRRRPTTTPVVTLSSRTATPRASGDTGVDVGDHGGPAGADLGDQAEEENASAEQRRPSTAIDANVSAEGAESGRFSRARTGHEGVAIPSEARHGTSGSTSERVSSPRSSGQSRRGRRPAGWRARPAARRPARRRRCPPARRRRPARSASRAGGSRCGFSEWSKRMARSATKSGTVATRIAGERRGDVDLAEAEQRPRHRHLDRGEQREDPPRRPRRAPSFHATGSSTAAARASRDHASRLGEIFVHRDLDEQVGHAPDRRDRGEQRLAAARSARCPPAPRRSRRRRAPRRAAAP